VREEVKFSVLQGQTLVSVEQIESDQIVFTTDTGKKYRLSHYQDCCESVVIESVVGDYADLIGVPILLAEEAASTDDPPDAPMQTRIQCAIGA
jgi:hypothetical protein